MNKEKLQKLKKLSKLFDRYINDSLYKDRPKRYDYLYVKMDNIPDYEYSYVLAYILSQKNERVKEHIKKAKAYKENLENYFETLNFTEFYKNSINLGYGGFLEEKKNLSLNNSFFEIDDSYLTLNDIEKFPFDLDVEHIGLWKLISYLIDTKNLYKNDDTAWDETDGISDAKYGLIDIDEAEKFIGDIMQNPYKYAAYCKHKDNEGVKLTALSEDMPLEILDQEFLKDLNIIRIKNKIPDVKINYSTPTLKFKNEKVVNIPVNLSLCKEELVAYILKIKDDFDEDNNIIKSPLEIFGENFESIKRTNSENIFPNKATKDNVLNPKWKRAISDALYIYDLYKFIEKIYNKKEKYNPHDIHIDVALASAISKVHNTILEKGLLGIDNDIKKSDRLEKYYKFMREYIDDERYKELITGFGKKEILGMWDKIPTSPIYSTAEDELKNYH